MSQDQKKRDRLPSPDRERLPFEDIDAGFYLHDREGLTCVTAEDGAYPDRYLIPVERFCEIQKERDELKQTLAFINAAVTPQGTKSYSAVVTRVTELVRIRGLTPEDGRVMQSIIDYDWSQL